MRRVSISELKARLSRYLDVVKAGEEVLVTERGKPVARLGPLAGDRDRSARMRELVRAGRVRPPRSEEAADLSEIPAPCVAGGRAVSALLEERRSGP